METSAKNRRQSPRAKLAQSARVRPFDPHLPTEICTTVNVSRNGFYFVTAASHFYAGLEVFVTRNFQPNDPTAREEMAEIVRVGALPNGKWGVAVRVVGRPTVIPPNF